MSQRQRIILGVSILAVVVAGMLLGLRYLGEALHRTLDPVTDIAQYPSLPGGSRAAS